jgi:hypothetical protein
MSDSIYSIECLEATPPLRRPALVKHDAPGYYQPYQAGHVEVLGSGAVRMWDVEIIRLHEHVDEMILSPKLGDIAIIWRE